jgi:MtfA peptidase
MFSALRRRLAGPAPAIAEPLWLAQVARLKLLQSWSVDDLARLRALCAQWLAQKSISGAAGLEVDEAMRVHIAAQACIPIFHLGLAWYRGWHGIVVYPGAFRVRRVEHDEDGLAHDVEKDLSGEAMSGGPVVLSWEDARDQGDATSAPGNVVIHEFAHKLDMLDGIADGRPPFSRQLHPGLDPARWMAVLEDAFERFCAEVDLVESEIPRDLDPDSEQADPYYANLPLDPYAASDHAEFFAVSSEHFFVDRERLQTYFPDWCGLLERFYRPESAPISPRPRM